MIKLGEKFTVQPRVRIGEWIRTNEQFVDGFELLPFTDYLTGSEIPTRTLSVNNFPDLWKHGYGWNDVKKTTDLVGISNNDFAYPSPSSVVYVNGHIYFRNDTKLYVDSTGSPDSLPANLLTSNYVYRYMPKVANDHNGLMTVGYANDENTNTLVRSDTGATWEDYLTFPTVLQDFDCSSGSNRIAAISSINNAGVYTQAVYEVVKDNTSGDFVINALPTVGLDTTQLVAEVYLVNDYKQQHPADYNVRNIIVRYQQSVAGKPMFAIYRRGSGTWENFSVPYEYATYTNGTRIFSGLGSKYLYLGFEKGIWKIDPDTLSMSEIKIISRYNRPPAADGSTVYPGENLSYNGTVVQCYISTYPDVDDTGKYDHRQFLLICGGNSLYVLDCKDDSVRLVRDHTKVGAEIKFLVGDDGNQFAWRADGKVEYFNRIPNLNFKVDAFKVNGVIDTTYRLVARKLP